MEAETLIIREGKFYRGGSPVKPELGNAEQIECLKQYETLCDTFKKGVIVDNIQYDMQPIDATASFRCICGNSIRVSAEASDDCDIDCFDGKKKRCRVCHADYEINDNLEGDLIVKLIS